MPADLSRPKRLLVVDDEPVILEVIALFLQGGGYRLTVADNGQEALRLFDAGTFDAVLTDRIMPEMNGDELAQEIKSRDPATPILLISGHRWSAVDATRFDGFLPKPFTQKSLVAAIDAALLRQKASMANAATQEMRAGSPSTCHGLRRICS